MRITRAESPTFERCWNQQPGASPAAAQRRPSGDRGGVVGFKCSRRLQAMGWCDASREPCGDQRLAESLTRSTGPTCSFPSHCHHIPPDLGRVWAAVLPPDNRRQSARHWCAGPWSGRATPSRHRGRMQEPTNHLTRLPVGISDGLNSRPRPRHRVCVMFGAASGPGAKDRPYKGKTTSDHRHHG